MTGFSRRPLAVFVCCLFAGLPASHAAALAADLPASAGAGNGAAAPILLAVNDNPVRLRVERKFNVLAKEKKPKDTFPVVDPQAPPAGDKEKESFPLFLVADQILGRVDEVTEATGHVELRRTGSLIFADKLTYRPLDDEVDANGKVRLLQDGAEFNTPHLQLRLSSQIGYAEQADYHIVKMVPSKFYRSQQTLVTVASSNATNAGAPMMLNVPNGYGLPTQSPPERPSEANGEAKRVDFQGQNHFRLTESTYSTCKPGATDWYLRTSTMDLDYDQNDGSARHASLWFKDVPIFYSPIASFPLTRESKTGFLHPSLSSSTKNGIDITAPYFWSLAPNYDVTFYPRYMSKRGMQLGAEARYLDYNYQGIWRGEYLPDDQIERRSRYAYTITHSQTLGRGVSASVNWNAVSDDFYWQDLNSHLLQTSQTQLPRQLVLSYTPSPWLQTSLQVLRYQTLQLDPENLIARPYFLEPQINVVGFKPNVLKTDFTMIGQYSRFTHPDKVQGDRFVFYPQFSLPIVGPAFQITPKIGVHMTRYNLDQPGTVEPTGISRTLPIFTLDSSVIFEREGDWLGKGYIQTLEPRLYYVNIPYRDQSQIPVFDSGLTDFNFAQIFSENRYSGFDRINDANQLTAALTTRFLDGDTGVERFKAMIGQRYYFKPQRVTIPGETARQDDFSDLVVAANGLVAPKTYVDVAWEYNYKDGLNERLSAGARFQPALGKVLSASYRYTRDPLTQNSTVDQIDIAGQWPISAKWYAVGRYNYSLHDKQLLETIAGVEYNAGCWAARVVGQRLEALAGSPNTTVYLQLELNDFASIGSNPLGLLRRSIPGYGKTNELPDSGSPLTLP